MAEESFVGTVESLEDDDDSSLLVEIQVETERDGADRTQEHGTTDKDISKEEDSEKQLVKGDCQLYGHVNVKCKSDKESCYIKGICGLSNNMWAVLDYQNKCMKIFDSGTNSLQRYMRFPLFPNDATEIKVKHSPVVTDSLATSNTRKSEARIGPESQRLVAVTLSYEYQIWIIDIDQVPARTVKTIKMKKQCNSIEFSDGKIFVHCEVVGKTEIRHYFVILSTAGEQLKVIDNEMFVGYSSAFAVYNRKIYWTDMSNNRILCIDVETQKVVSQFPKEKSEPNGIATDSKGNIFVCGRGLEQVLKLSSNLSRSEPLSLDTDCTRYSRILCISNGKLYIAKLLGSGNDIITVIKINCVSNDKGTSSSCCCIS